MLATRVLQKEGTFYFIAYKATELLDRVSFSSRYYFEGEQIDADEPGDDEVAKFIAGIEKSEKSFQRLLNRRKIGQIVNFYETAVSQPLIPGTILLLFGALLGTPLSGLTQYLWPAVLIIVGGYLVFRFFRNQSTG